jgi:hypothetical protein
MLGVILRMGWKGLAVLSVIFFGFAGFILQSGLQFEADKAAALQGPMPEMVPLEAFDATRDVHLAQEVHVQGQINPEYNYTLTEHHTGKGPDYDVVRRMFVLFGPEDAVDAKVARAVVLLHEDQVDAFVGYTADNAVEFTDQGFSFALNGAADTVPDLEDMADDALVKEGLTKASNFVFIEPWLEGRAAALAPAPDVPWGAAGMVSVPAVVFFLMAVWRKRRGAYIAPVAQVASVTAAPLMAVPAAAKMGSFTGKVVLGYAAMFAALWMGVWWAGPALVFVTMALIVRGMKRGLAAGAREVLALGRNVQAALAPATFSAPTATVATTAQSAALPPAIRPGFRFADLIPKRAETPVATDDAYARLAASIRDERMRQQGA